MADPTGTKLHNILKCITLNEIYKSYLLCIKLQMYFFEAPYSRRYNENSRESYF